MATCTCRFASVAEWLAALARFDRWRDLFVCVACGLRVTCDHGHTAVICCKGETVPNNDDDWAALGTFPRGDYLGCLPLCPGAAA